jgi:uncharacterized membrane protein YfcA
MFVAIGFKLPGLEFCANMPAAYWMSCGEKWMYAFAIIVLGLVVGVLVGLTGAGGGTVIVPALVYLLGMDQHLAQGTSLLVLLPPTGLGALYVYWKEREVDLRVGLVCAAGFLLGGYAGGLVAVRTPSRHLSAFFGLFLILAATLLWREARNPDSDGGRDA